MHCVLLVINEEHITEEEERNRFFAALLRIQNRIAGKSKYCILMSLKIIIQY